MKRAPTPVDLVVASESSYQQALADAAGSGLGEDPGFGFGVRAAGGGTGIGGREHDAPRHPSPAACSPPPVVRDRAAGGRWRGTGPGSGAGWCPGRLGGGACWLMRTGLVGSSPGCCGLEDRAGRPAFPNEGQP